jgi:uncharacterized protein (DUF1697 family)
MKYLALLRGINVGGNTLIKMAELKTCFEELGFAHVRTYINSGNVIFSSDETDTLRLAQMIESAIKRAFAHELRVVVFAHGTWRAIIEDAPKRWGQDHETYRYNLLVLLPPVTAEEAVKACGDIKPDIEFADAGEGVIYQGAQWKMIGRTNYSKIIGKPVYKQMTIRNYNTSVKLLKLMNEL